MTETKLSVSIQVGSVFRFLFSQKQKTVEIGRGPTEDDMPSSSYSHNQLPLVTEVCPKQYESGNGNRSP